MSALFPASIWMTPDLHACSCGSKDADQTLGLLLASVNFFVYNVFMLRAQDLHHMLLFPLRSLSSFGM